MREPAAGRDAVGAAAGWSEGRGGAAWVGWGISEAVGDGEQETESRPCGRGRVQPAAGAQALRRRRYPVTDVF